MALPNTDNLDFFDEFGPANPVNLATWPNASTDTLDYFAAAGPLEWIYHITPVTAGSIIDVMGPGVTPFTRT